MALAEEENEFEQDQWNYDEPEALKHEPGEEEADEAYSEPLDNEEYHSHVNHLAALIQQDFKSSVGKDSAEAAFAEECLQNYNLAMAKGDREKAREWAERLQMMNRDKETPEPGHAENQATEQARESIEGYIDELCELDPDDLAARSTQPQKDLEEILMERNRRFADKTGKLYVLVDADDLYRENIDNVSGKHVKVIPCKKNAQVHEGGFSWPWFEAKGYDTTSMADLRTFVRAMGGFSGIQRPSRKGQAARRREKGVERFIKERNEAEDRKRPASPKKGGENPWIKE